MDKQSQLKVIAAGFSIIRADDQPNIRIKWINKDMLDWHTKEKFETKSSRDARFKELLENPKVIAD